MFDWIPSNSYWVNWLDVNTEDAVYNIALYEYDPGISDPTGQLVASRPLRLSWSETSPKTTSTTSKLSASATCGSVQSASKSSTLTPGSTLLSPELRGQSGACLGTGVIAGVAVGSCCFDLLIGCLIMFLLRRVRGRKVNKVMTERDMDQDQDMKEVAPPDQDISKRAPSSYTRCSDPALSLSVVSTATPVEHHTRRRSLSRIHEMPFHSGPSDGVPVEEANSP